MHQSHTSKTLKYVADNLHAFHAMKDIFTTSQTFKATDIITIACRKNLEMQLKFKHAMEDEEKPSCSEDQSGSPMDEWNGEYQKHQQRVYNSTLWEHTSFEFIYLHLMLQYKESISHFRHLVRDSTDMQNINCSKMCIGHYPRFNCNFV